MYERTRFGTTPHSQKVVQESDAYDGKEDGKIKRTFVRGSLRSQEVVCTLFFAACNRTLQGEGGAALFTFYFIFNAKMGGARNVRRWRLRRFHAAACNFAPRYDRRTKGLAAGFLPVDF